MWDGATNDLGNSLMTVSAGNIPDLWSSSIDDGVSECNLDGGTFDLCVINNGSLEHLREFEICSFAAHFMNRYKTAD